MTSVSVVAGSRGWVRQPAEEKEAAGTGIADEEDEGMVGRDWGGAERARDAKPTMNENIRLIATNLPRFRFIHVASMFRI